MPRLADPESGRVTRPRQFANVLERDLYLADEIARPAARQPNHCCCASPLVEVLDGDLGCAG
jgi:hypothetical protein